MCKMTPVVRRPVLGTPGRTVQENNFFPGCADFFCSNSIDIDAVIDGLFIVTIVQRPGEELTHSIHRVFGPWDRIHFVIKQGCHRFPDGSIAEPYS